MAKVYANEFTEQELKDLVDILQIAAWPEAARVRASGNSVQHVLYEPVGNDLCRNREQPVPDRDEEARQGYLIESNKPGSGSIKLRRSDRRAG